MSTARRQVILSVLRASLEGRGAAAPDLAGLADAIEAAITRSEAALLGPDPDGRTPDELNASNDV